MRIIFFFQHYLCHYSSKAVNPKYETCKCAKNIPMTIERSKATAWTSCLMRHRFVSNCSSISLPGIWICMRECNLIHSNYSKTHNIQAIAHFRIQQWTPLYFVFGTTLQFTFTRNNMFAKLKYPFWPQCHLNKVLYQYNSFLSFFIF